MSVYQDTIDSLKDLAEKNEAILVAFSGGKDSLALLDLCVKTFRKVVGFHMYCVPGLRVMEEMMEDAKTRWGVPCVYYPHPATLKELAAGAYCDCSYRKDKLPQIKLHEVYQIAMCETGINLLATGAKDADGAWRRRWLWSVRDWEGVIYPLQTWNKHDVLAYLRANKIPIPDGDGNAKNCSGIGLSVQSVCWLHDRYPDDFKLLLDWFPYAEAVIWRRKFYGIGPFYDPIIQKENAAADRGTGKVPAVCPAGGPPIGDKKRPVQSAPDDRGVPPGAQKKYRHARAGRNAGVEPSQRKPDRRASAAARN